MQLETNLHTLQKNDDSIDKYLQRVKHARDELAFVGVHFADEDIMIIALNGLPPEYNNIRVVIKAMDRSVSMEEFRSQLLTVERDFEKMVLQTTQNTISAMVAHTEQSARRFNESSSNAGNYSNSFSQNVQYGMSHTGMSSRYTGDCSTAPVLHNATSNVGFLPNVTNTSVLSGISAYNRFTTSSSGSNVHHHYSPSPISTTHFGMPQNKIISSSIHNVPTAAPNCQEIVPLTQSIGISQSAPTSGYLLSNNVGNGTLYSASPPPCVYATENGNSMIQNGGQMVQNGGYVSFPQHNYSQKQGFSNNSGTYSNAPMQQGSFSQGPNISSSQGKCNIQKENLSNNGNYHSETFNGKFTCRSFGNKGNRSFGDNKRRDDRGRNNGNNVSSGYSSGNNVIPECQICRKRGHTTVICYWRSDNNASPSIVDCQICGKRGHVSSVCHQRSNSSFLCAAPPPTFTAMNVLATIEHCCNLSVLTPTEIEGRCYQNQA
ncbi:putative transcription factor interactor and regulator CCHC(Zn) family [Rosa chinensis]|uniref:Putative transcription factor interactor and regulator CCHC(Zn) family n=1 Tax=Rosa chinensis TaxID=74649 RepID=A0A2P6QGG9_ROSCH|nr:putative transcription factor interactor and regulator CCHC(Zn) family [Rosa chinensis]